jgi:FKBP-type peptidyl-prolyl cis-trans isomerase SlyD
VQILETVADGAVVAIGYVLTDDSGKVLDATDQPHLYLHGRGGILPGLERALTGKKAGDHVSVDLTPEQAYGTPSGPGPQPVPRKEFRRDRELFPGMAFRAQGTEGQEITLYITKVLGSKVWVDRNHPLAGKALHFEVDVLLIREATWEEAQHGHVHGLDGVMHEHGEDQE